MIEEAKLVLRGEDGQHGSIDLRLGEFAVFHELGKVLGVGLAGHVHVESGRKRLVGGV